MHELSIAMSLLDLAEQEAARHEGARVVAIHVHVGALSGIVKEALLNAYELARAGTELEQAELMVEEVPVSGYCPECDGTRAAISIQQLHCSECGSTGLRDLSGTELQLVALEVET